MSISVLPNNVAAEENHHLKSPHGKLDSLSDKDDVEARTEADEDASDDTITPPSDPLPPPVIALKDGGTRAWLQVLGAFLVFANLWGFTFAFGAFQSYYELSYLPDSSPSNISWIGTVSAFLLVFIGVISGPLFDLGYFKAMLLTGAAMQTLSVFMLSLCRTYWQVMLAQGLLQGLGNGLLYLPGLALVGRSFQKQRAMAMGILTCGAPVGGIIYTIIFTTLIDRYTFGWTVRVMGFVMLASYAISFPLQLWGVTNLGDLASGKARKLFDKKALQDIPFWCYTMSQFFLFWGYLVPFFYMATYGQNELGLSQSFSLYVTIIAQATSVAGRLVAPWVGLKSGIFIPWLIAGGTSGILCFAWIGVKSQASYIAFSALYGFFSGPIVPLPPSIFPIVCPWPEVLGARLGMSQAFNSIATLTGSPIAGALLRVHSESTGTRYLGVQLFSGCVMTVGAGWIAALWFALQRRGGVKKLI